MGCGVKDMWQISPGHSTGNQQIKPDTGRAMRNVSAERLFAKNGLLHLRE